MFFSGDLIRTAQASGPVWLLSRMSSSPKQQPAGDEAVAPLTLVCSLHPLLCFEPYWECGVGFPPPSKSLFLTEPTAAGRSFGAWLSSGRASALR